MPDELDNTIEKLVTLIEDLIDGVAVENSDFSEGEDFEKVASELGL